MGKKITTEEFVKRAKGVHGDKYDYSKVEYKGNHKNILILCKEHGEFPQTPSAHLQGQGCPICGRIKASNKLRSSKEDFIKHSKEIHGDKYDYSKVEYKNTDTKVCIICPIHGDFFIQPKHHLNGCGCQKCKRKENGVLSRSNTNEFIEKAKKIHGKKYDYSKVEYVKAKTKVCIICPKHGEFWQIPNDHLHGRGCPKCNESRLERELRLCFEKEKINYVYQCNKSNFEWLGRKRLDFYLPKYNIAIECQGEQHFMPIKHFGGYNNLMEVVNNDELKRKLCIEHGVKMIYYSDLKIDFPYDVITNKEKLIKKIRI